MSYPLTPHPQQPVPTSYTAIQGNDERGLSDYSQVDTSASSVAAMPNRFANDTLHSPGGSGSGATTPNYSRDGFSPGYSYGDSSSGGALSVPGLMDVSNSSSSDSTQPSPSHMATPQAIHDGQFHSNQMTDGRLSSPMPSPRSGYTYQHTMPFIPNLESSQNPLGQGSMYGHGHSRIAPRVTQQPSPPVHDPRQWMMMMLAINDHPHRPIQLPNQQNRLLGTDPEESTPSHSPSGGRRPVVPLRRRIYVDFKSKTDVAMGRGGFTNHNEGKKEYRDLVRAYQPGYHGIPKVQRNQREAYADGFVAEVLLRFRFVHKDGQGWYLADKRAVIEKIKQALREHWS